MMSTAEYGAQLGQLLPRGVAFARDSASHLGRLLLGYAGELSRTDGAIRSLIRESLPTRTAELLPEWERAAGLPDPCVSVPQSLGDRRRALVSRLTSTGGASPAYFVGVARRLGYTAAIEIIDTHVWRLNIAESTGVTLFRAGGSRSGDKLRTFGNQQLECVITRLAPAHTRVLFAYGVDLSES